MEFYNQQFNRKKITLKSDKTKWKNKKLYIPYQVPGMYVSPGSVNCTGNLVMNLDYCTAGYCTVCYCTVCTEGSLVPHLAGVQPDHQPLLPNHRNPRIYEFIIILLTISGCYTYILAWWIFKHASLKWFSEKFLLTHQFNLWTEGANVMKPVFLFHFCTTS